MNSFESQKTNLADLVVAGAALAAFTLAMFAPFWFGGHSVYFSIIEEGFPVAANYPWDLFAAKCLSMGRFPLWNPFSSGGTVFIGNWLESFFFFPRWILYLSPSFIVRDVYVVFRYWLGGMFFFVFARQIGLRNFGAIIGALCFVSGGYFTRYYNENYLNVEIMLGLWLLAADYLATRLTVRSVFVAGLAITAIIFAGHPEAAFHTLAIMGFWVIYRAGKNAPRAALLFGFAGVGAVLASACQLVPFAESWAFSTNYHIPNLGRAHYELKHLASLAFPWIFGKFPFFLAQRNAPDMLLDQSYAATAINWIPYYLGAAPMLMAGAAFIEARRVNRAVLFFMAYLVVTLGMVFGIEPFRQITALPFLSRLGNYKHIFPLITFSTAIMAGMGAELTLREKFTGKARHILPIAALLFVVGIYAAFKSPAVEKWHYLAVFGLTPVLLVSMFAFAPSRAAKIAGITAIIAATALTYPKGYFYNRQEGLLNIIKTPYMKYLTEHKDGSFYSLYPPLFPNSGVIWELSDVRASDALQPKRYWDILLDVNGGDEKYMRDYFFAAGLIGPVPESLGNPKLKELGLRYIVTPGDLGGAIAVNYLHRVSVARVPGRRYYYWSLWNVGGDRRPTLLTHPPALIELPNPPPPESDKLDVAVAYNPTTPNGTDGAFMNVVSEKDGKRRVLYCRHISPDEKAGWVPAIKYPSEKSAKISLLVHPGQNTDHDWVGWGFKSCEKQFVGFEPALDGDVMVYKTVDPLRWTILTDNSGAELSPDPSAKMIYMDEYEVYVQNRSGKLRLNFLGYRPGWKAWADGKETRIHPDRSIELTKTTDKVQLKYQPVSFAIGLWVSIASVVFGIIAFSRRSIARSI